MPAERQIQALNMSPRGISVDDSNVTSTPLLAKDTGNFPTPVSTRQPSHFSRVINQNNLDFPVTCSYDFQTANEGFHYSQAPLTGTQLSRKRSFNQSYISPSCQVAPQSYNNTYGELTVDIPNLKQREVPVASNSIPCSPHSWVNSNQSQCHQVFSIDDMGALRGHNSYNFSTTAAPSGMARSVSFGADSFPDQQYSVYSEPSYGQGQNKRSSFQGPSRGSNTVGCDLLSESSGFYSLYCNRGQRSPGSDRPFHVDQLNTSQFGSDVSNVESVFSQFSETQSMEFESLKSPRDSYGANEELRTSFSSGSQCSENVQRNELGDLMGPQSHSENLDDHRMFYVGGYQQHHHHQQQPQQQDTCSNNVVLSNTWSHMDLAIGRHQSSLPTTPHGYQTGALNALNLDGGFEDVDFDSFLEDMNTFSYRPHLQSSEIDHTETEITASIPVNTTPNSTQISPCNNASSTMARSCSLENILEDINKTATSIGASQNTLFDVLNLDTVTEVHEPTNGNQNVDNLTPKRVPNVQQFESQPQISSQSFPQSQQSRPVSQAVIQPPQHFESRNAHQQPLYSQQTINTYPSGRQTEFVNRVDNRNNDNINTYEFFNNFANYPGTDVISKSPKHKRWKLSVIDRPSRSPSLEDIPTAFNNMPQKRNTQHVYSVPSPLTMNSTSTSNPNTVMHQNPASVAGVPMGCATSSGRRAVRSKTFSNPRMRSASNPSSVIGFSDDEELIINEGSSGMYVSGGVAANRRCNSDASKRHHYDSSESYHKHASHHSLDNRERGASSGRQSGFSSFNSRSSSCSSSSIPPQPEKQNTNSGPPININISVINLITSDGGESVVPVKLSNVTSNVLSSVVADQTETATRIAKLFQDKGNSEQNASSSSSSSNSAPCGSSGSSSTYQSHNIAQNSVIADDHDYWIQSVSFPSIWISYGLQKRF